MRVGDVLTFPQGHQIRVVRIVALGTRRGPAAEARLLSCDEVRLELEFSDAKIFGFDVR